MEKLEAGLVSGCVWRSAPVATPASVVVVVNENVGAAGMAALEARFTAHSVFPILWVTEAVEQHRRWLREGPASTLRSVLRPLGTDCLLLLVERGETPELDWLGSVVGQPLQRFVLDEEGCVAALHESARLALLEHLAV